MRIVLYAININNREMSRYKDNIEIYNNIGIEGFRDWLIDNIYLKKKRLYPFSIPLSDSFENLLLYIYNSLSKEEKKNMRVVLGDVAGEWSVEKYGFASLTRLFEYAGIIKAVGVYIVVAQKLVDVKPKPGEDDLIAIIEIGKFLNEVLISLNDGYIKYSKESPFYDLMKSCAAIFEGDQEGYYRYIYSPMFRLACKADYNQWPRLGSILAYRYERRNLDKWPESLAKYENYRGGGGYFDIKNTIIELFFELKRMPYICDDDILRGCKKLQEDYMSSGGNDFLSEMYSAGIVDIYDSGIDNMNAEISLKSEWMKNICKKTDPVIVSTQSMFYYEILEYNMRPKGASEMINKYNNVNINKSLSQISLIRGN
jgi:hypothetical protein